MIEFKGQYPLGVISDMLINLKAFASPHFENRVGGPERSFVNYHVCIVCMYI